jgi:hypothetical protein
MPNVGKKDPYGVLEISRDATEDEIKAGYKRMVNAFAFFHWTYCHSRFIRPSAGTLIAMSREKK